MSKTYTLYELRHHCQRAWQAGWDEGRVYGRREGSEAGRLEGLRDEGRTVCGGDPDVGISPAYEHCEYHKGDPECMHCFDVRPHPALHCGEGDTP